MKKGLTETKQDSGLKGVSVAIMAGGKSSRMGVDKAFVPFQGRPMIEIVRDQLSGLGEEQILITNRPASYAHLGLPMFADLIPGCGPLGGIYTAVAQASCAHVLIVACDMPWLNRDLLEYQLSLRHTADIIVPRWRKFPEPLHAVYTKGCLPSIAAQLKSNQLKIVRFYGKVRVRYVEKEEIERYDKNGRSFANINTPQDLEAAQYQTGQA